MIIAVNTRLLLKDRLDGIGWFTFETLKRITNLYSNHQFLFLFDRPFSNEFIFSPNIKPFVIFPPTRHPWLWYIWFEYSIPRFLNTYKPDLFLSPDGFIPLKSIVPSLSVIHDINFIHRPQDIPYFARNYYNKYFPLFAQKATRIATVSEYSKNDLVKSLRIPAAKIDVVYNGASELLMPISKETKQNIKKRYTDGQDFFIFIGSLHPRKNVESLLLAFDAFKKENDSPMKMVIVGDTMFKTESINQVYSNMAFSHDVVFTGRATDSELKLLLGSAFALTFVPFFEGFGIPLLESMFCDVPILTSNITSMPEVCGDAALLVDPYSVESIKLGILQLYKDENLRNSLILKAKERRKHFSWNQSANRLWQSIEKSVQPPA
jgi:glycosyltransferase involved in cell wall biosynthesis